MSKTILALESSSETCSVALLHNGEINHRSSNEPRGHAKNILPMIDELTSQAGVQLSELDAIALTNGPGAFTSVRIGTAVCQGIATANNIPVISLSSLEVLALGAMQQSGLSNALVALDARMNEVYFGAYCLTEEGQAIAVQDDQVTSPQAINLENVSEEHQWVASGMGWQAYQDDMTKYFSSYSYQVIAHDFPSAVDLLKAATRLYEQGNTSSVHDLVPVYLRDNVVRS